jgi:Amt family ammonium transporter
MGPTDNSVFILLCTPLVLVMQLGFAMVEAGLIESRHCISILFKNVLDVCIGAIAYVFIGAFIQFAPDYQFVLDGWMGVAPPIPADGATVKHPTAVLVYNAVFAATAATIISGTIAGRANVGPYLVLSTSITLFLYPVVARVMWGPWDPWLPLANPLHDLAGSVVVHTVGGMAAFGAALALKPRSDPSPKSHNIPLVVIGALTLWFGWYGFNCGSIAEAVGTPAGVSVASRVALNTTLAAAAGGTFVWFLQALGFKDKSLPEVLNGILGGLVIVTASADIVSPWWPVAYGLLAALIVSYWPHYAAGRRILGIGVIDDPVGAIPVHGFCGVAGGVTAAVATGSLTTVMWQVPIVLALALFCAVVGFVLVAVMNRTPRLRFQVEDEIERTGIDIAHLHDTAYRFDTDPNTVPFLVERLRYQQARGAEYTFRTAVWEPGDGPATTRFKYDFFRWHKDALSDALKAARFLPATEEGGKEVTQREVVRRRFRALEVLSHSKLRPDAIFHDALEAACALLGDLAEMLEELMAERRRMGDITVAHETRIGALERQASDVRAAMEELIEENRRLRELLAERAADGANGSRVG